SYNALATSAIYTLSLHDALPISMRIFELTKHFPPEERYALTSQIRRSSRSVCTNLREAWAKRRYVAHFTSKLTDSDGENAETDRSEEHTSELQSQSNLVCRLLLE